MTTTEDTAARIEPRPCPFCGSAEITVDWSHAAVYAYCGSCGTIGPDEPIQAGDDSTFADQVVWRAVALVAWNRCIPDPRLADLLTSCEAVLHQLRDGEASDGDRKDIAWCAAELAGAIAEAKGETGGKDSNSERT